MTIYSKQQWKSTIGKLIKHANEVDLIDKMKTYKKLDSLDITNESCKVKNYMQNLDLRGARLRFKLRSKMLPTVKANFKSKKEFIQKNWTCEGCVTQSQSGEALGSLDTQEHIQICEAYEDLREGKNLDNDKDLTSYFSSVIRRRMGIN